MDNGEDTRTATLGDGTVPLRLPKSHAIRWEVWRAAGTNTDRAFSAALGVAWFGSRRPKARYDRCGYDVMVYGGQVFDELVARGHAPLAIIAAGAVAYQWIGDSVITEEELTAAEDFSEGGDSSTESSSPSAEATANPPVGGPA